MLLPSRHITQGAVSDLASRTARAALAPMRQDCKQKKLQAFNLLKTWVLPLLQLSPLGILLLQIFHNIAKSFQLHVYSLFTSLLCKKNNIPFLHLSPQFGCVPPLFMSIIEGPRASLTYSVACGL